MTVMGVIPADELDLDQDGISACEGDCDDSNAAINPGQSDICNGLDDGVTVISLRRRRRKL